MVSHLLCLGREILAGRSSRTNDAGIRVVAKVFSWLKVTTIDVGDTLHLKSGIAMAGPTTIISSVGDKNAAEIMRVNAGLNITAFKIT